MRETKRPDIYPCQTMLHTLMFQDVLESNVMMKGIAIIKSTTNKNSCNNSQIIVHLTSPILFGPSGP